jgi:hypothetical protein
MLCAKNGMKKIINGCTLTEGFFKIFSFSLFFTIKQSQAQTHAEGNFVHSFARGNSCNEKVVVVVVNEERRLGRSIFTPTSITHKFNIL